MLLIMKISKFHQLMRNSSLSEFLTICDTNLNDSKEQVACVTVSMAQKLLFLCVTETGNADWLQCGWWEQNIIYKTMKNLSLVMWNFHLHLIIMMMILQLLISLFYAAPFK